MPAGVRSGDDSNSGNTMLLESTPDLHQRVFAGTPIALSLLGLVHLLVYAPGGALRDTGLGCGDGLGFAVVHE